VKSEEGEREVLEEALPLEITLRVCVGEASVEPLATGEAVGSRDEVVESVVLAEPLAESDVSGDVVGREEAVEFTVELALEDMKAVDDSVPVAVPICDTEGRIVTVTVTVAEEKEEAEEVTVAV
jgi:hypothetical protein